MPITEKQTVCVNSGFADPADTTKQLQFDMSECVSGTETVVKAPPTACGFLPTGAIIDFGGSTAPSGFLACNGAAVSRTTYAALFTAIGTLWGTGDGSTTFNIPNFTAGLAAVQSAGTVGAATDGTIPAHTHSVVLHSVLRSPDGAGGGSVQMTDPTTQSTGSYGTGTANLAAGKYVLKCIKT